MKKSWMFCFLVCFMYACSFEKCSSSAANPVMEDPDEQFVHMIPDTGDEPSSPYFFVKSNDPEKSWLPLQSTRAYARITGNIANVKVEQIYENKSKRTLDAIYISPGSTRAAVYGLDISPRREDQSGNVLYGTAGIPRQNVRICLSDRCRSPLFDRE